MHPVRHARRNMHEIVRRDLDPIPVQHHHSAARNRENEEPGLVFRRDGHGGPRLHDRVLEAQTVQHAREIENGVATQLVCGTGQLREAAIGVTRHYSSACRARQPYAEGAAAPPKWARRAPCASHSAPSVSPGVSPGSVAMLPARRLFGAVCSAVLPITAAAAQGWIEPIRPVPLPAPTAPRSGIEKVRSAVQVAVVGRVARVTVEEWFRNAGALLDEGNYLYPLPGEAVFSDFSLWQGDRELKGEPMDAAQARAIYEEIVRRKRDPALIELAGHGLVRARVFPIAPGETRKITLRYTQLLDRVGDAWRFRYPGAAGPASAGARSFRVLVDSAAQFVDPYSPTHRLTLTRASDRLEITLADTSARSDVELFLPLAHGLVGVSFVGSQPASEDGFFMLLVAPGDAREAPAVARDLVAVLDVSGSMSGEKLDQAKAALGQ